jgi:hypothetical protein
MLQSCLTSAPIDLCPVIGATVLRVVGDVVLVELAFPVQVVANKATRVLQNVFLRVLEGVTAGWNTIGG